jgi:hypothetical protein
VGGRLELLADVVGVVYATVVGKPQPQREDILPGPADDWTSEKINEAALLEHVVQEHPYRKFGEMYYHRNKTEIDAVAGPHKVEVKTTKPRRGYPRGIVTLTRKTMPRFLQELAGVTET